jgi:hypothetical protein
MDTTVTRDEDDTIGSDVYVQFPDERANGSHRGNVQPFDVSSSPQLSASRPSVAMRYNRVAARVIGAVVILAVVVVIAFSSLPPSADRTSDTGGVEPYIATAAFDFSQARRLILQQVRLSISSSSDRCV